MTFAAVALALTLAGAAASSAVRPVAFAVAAPVSGASVGHTSVAFKLALDGGLTAAFKPASKRGGARWRGEIAAYRLARALGIDRNVPVVYARAFEPTPLRAALTEEGGPLFDTEVTPVGGQVWGALWPWRPRYDVLPLESTEWRARWRRWLGEGPAPQLAEERALAAQIVQLLLFDLVTGNWDRWSGGNVALERDTQTLLFVDNDAAFFDPPPAGPLAAQRALVRSTSRFSRSFATALAALDRAALVAAMGELDGQPLLSAAQLEGIETRRNEALASIQAKVRARGEAATLAFE